MQFRNKESISHGEFMALLDPENRICFSYKTYTKMHWPGIEPGPPVWQARILPLNHQSDWLQLSLLILRSFWANCYIVLFSVLCMYARIKKETKKVCVWTKVKIDFSQFL